MFQQPHYLALFLIGSTSSAASPALAPCWSDHASSQRTHEYSICVSEDADTSLNTAYRELKEKVLDDYKADPERGKKLLEHIKKSQRLWINLREENCAIESFVISPSAQAFDTTRNFCLARESTERTRYLQSLRF
jgi:uncharacterized protein YecT (DUF1311 family)